MILFIMNFLNKMFSIFYKLKLEFFYKITRSLQKKIVYSILSDLSVPSDIDCKSIDGLPENKIWVCWFQGLDTAPEIVKKSIKNLKELNSNTYEINVITLENYNNFIDFPNFILSKIESGKISLTQFSDILRFALLSKHGGMWIDATYFSLKPLPIYISDISFFTLKGSDSSFFKWIPEGKWSGNFIKFGKNDPIANYIYNLFLSYWSKYDYLIDYFLIDYVLSYVYDNNVLFKERIDNCTIIGNNVFLLNSILFKEVNYGDNCKIRSDLFNIYKLTYKFDPLKKTQKNTYYKYFFES